MFKLIVNMYHSPNLLVSTQQHMGLYLLSCYLNIIRTVRVPAVKIYIHIYIYIYMYIYYRLQRGGLFGRIKTESPYITLYEGFIVALHIPRPVNPSSNHF